MLNHKGANKLFILDVLHKIEIMKIKNIFYVYYSHTYSAWYTSDTDRQVLKIIINLPHGIRHKKCIKADRILWEFKR